MAPAHSKGRHLEEHVKMVFVSVHSASLLGLGTRRTLQSALSVFLLLVLLPTDLGHSDDRWAKNCSLHLLNQLIRTLEQGRDNGLWPDIRSLNNTQFVQYNTFKVAIWNSSNKTYGIGQLGTCGDGSNDVYNGMKRESLALVYRGKDFFLLLSLKGSTLVFVWGDLCSLSFFLFLSVN